jgi:carboxyl-terminal processing protease
MRVPRAFQSRNGWVAGAIIASSLMIGAFTLVAADIDGPQPRDKEVTKQVAKMLESEHLLRRRVDDDTATRGLKLFLENLDPLKVYFVQTDVQYFHRSAPELASAIRDRGDTQFAYEVFERLMVRVNQRLKLVNQLLDEEFDFTQDEVLNLDAKKMTYAKTDEEIRDRWRKRLKYDLLDLKADKLTADEAKKKLIRRYTSFRNRMDQTSSDDLLEIYLSSITSSYDPHTTYMSPSTLENFEIMMSLNLEGIGARLTQEDGYTVVKEVLAGGAAAKQGELKAEDRIVSVAEGVNGEVIDIVDMRLNDVVKKIRGKPDTIVRLGVKSGSGAETRTIEISRSKVPLSESEARGKVFDVEHNGAMLKLGVINLPSFYMDMDAARRNVPGYKSTTRDVRRIITEFRRQGVNALVVDLRRNGGGSLTEAVDLTGLFVADGPIVQVRDLNGGQDVLEDSDPSIVWSGPLVVVTSKFSASASEILAGAIQDYRRGLIVGDPSTHGKGTVQSLQDIGRRAFRSRLFGGPKLGALKITMQQFYRPNGESTQQRGVLSDVIIPSLSAHRAMGEADLENAVPYAKVEPVPYRRYNMVSDAVVKYVRDKSTLRIDQSEKFTVLSHAIDAFKTRKERKSVSLNEVEFFKERDEIGQDEDKLAEELASDSNEIERDFFMDEVFKITLDYVDALGAQSVAAAKR